MDKQEKLLVTESELIKILGISRYTLQEWQKEYKFPMPLKSIGYGRNRYSFKEVEKWIDKQHKINNKN